MGGVGGGRVDVMWLCVLCNDSMAPGLMHILFVHSDGFVIKEFHFLLPSAEEKREREGGREDGDGALRDV